MVLPVGNHPRRQDFASPLPYNVWDSAAICKDEFLYEALAVLFAVLCPLVVSAQQALLSDADQAEAIKVGAKAEGRVTRVLLMDMGNGNMGPLFGNAFVTASNPAIDTAEGFSIRVYTPKTWIHQAGRRRREALQAVHRRGHHTRDAVPNGSACDRHPDKPTKLTGGGVGVASNVEHVVLRDDAKTLVVPRQLTEPFTDTASSVFRDMAFRV